MADLISQTDLENALGVNVVLAIYDDDHDGAVDSASIDACTAYATAKVYAFLAGEYAFALPLTVVPDIVKFAAVDFACAYSARRRPDIVRAMSEKSWTDFDECALTNMKMFVTGLERVPSATGTPSNVGGFTVDGSSRIIVDDADGTPNAGDF